MKDLSLFIDVLKKVRFEILDKHDFRLADFDFGSPSYQLLTSIDDACLKLNSIIDFMELVSKNENDDSNSCK